MNYATPDQANVCPCRDRERDRSVFCCPTGHLMECHFPLECEEAACGHLIHYGEAYEENMPELEAAAWALLEQYADPACDQCDGDGMNMVTRNINPETPENTILSALSPAYGSSIVICPCTVPQMVCHQCKKSGPMEEFIGYLNRSGPGEKFIAYLCEDCSDELETPDDIEVFQCHVCGYTQEDPHCYVMECCWVEKDLCRSCCYPDDDMVECPFR